MGPIFSLIAKQACLIFHVLFPVTLVWETLVSIVDYVTQPWRNLFWFSFNLYLGVWSGLGYFSMKILVLPIRIYNAMQKEDMMEIEMQEIQKLHNESELRIRELECELEQVLDDCKHFKCLLEDAETEKMAFLKKFQQLQLRTVELEEENDLLRAKEERVLKGIHEAKVFIPKRDTRNSSHEKSHKDEFDHIQPSDKYMKEMARKIPLELEIRHENAVCNVDRWLVSDRATHQGRRATQHVQRWLVSDRVTHEGRKVALSASLFSIFLSLLVGTIAWQAQDPCIPLVVAVFMVVCMSLKTVAQFLLSIYNGPGFDAVALVSFNCFILGTLAYPVLPRIAQTVAPIGTKFGQWFLRVMGVSYIAEKLRSAFL
eukprot:c585_g1_i1 orf=270-1382(+)